MDISFAQRSYLIALNNLVSLVNVNVAAALLISAGPTCHDDVTAVRGSSFGLQSAEATLSAGVKLKLFWFFLEVRLLYMCMCSPVDSSVQCMLHDTSTQLYYLIAWYTGAVALYCVYLVQQINFVFLFDSSLAGLHWCFVVSIQ